MNPHELVGIVRPANNFAMGGMPMHLARILLLEGKSLPEHLFLDVMVEKTQILIEFVWNHHLGLCLTANITLQLSRFMTILQWAIPSFSKLLCQIYQTWKPNSSNYILKYKG